MERLQKLEEKLDYFASKGDWDNYGKYAKEYENEFERVYCTVLSVPKREV